MARSVDDYTTTELIALIKKRPKVTVQNLGSGRSGLVIKSNDGFRGATVTELAATDWKRGWIIFSNNG